MDAVRHLILLRACAAFTSIAPMVPVETILREALELPPEQRAQLVNDLQRSLPLSPAPAPAPLQRIEQDTPISWEGAQGFLED